MPLEFEDQRHLTAAEGYCELGMFLESNDQLEKIEPDVRHLPEVLAVRYVIYSGMKKWELAYEVANHLCRCETMGGEHFLSAAFCLHEMKRTKEAKEKLLAGPTSLHKQWVYHYNMACYECQLGDLESAKTYLRTAFKRNPAARAEALDDPDLEAVWGSICTHLD